MRVVIVVRSQSGVPGGAGVPGGQIGMVQLARALAAAGIDVEMFVGGRRMRYLRGLDGVRTTYFRWPAWLERIAQAGPSRVRASAAGLRRRRWLEAVANLPGLDAADVIHVQGLEDAERLLPRIGGPLVVTHWGRVRRWQAKGDGDREGLADRLERIRQQVRLVAIGEAQGQALAEVGLPPADVIPPGIDLDHFTPGDRAQAKLQLGMPAGQATVLYVGRLAPDKDVATLLRAFALPSPHAARSRLLVIGDGPLGAELQGLAHELGIGAATTFLPFVAHEDLPAYYRACDVTVVPSDRLETFCMVALEAIACGSPLIVTDQVPEIIRRFPTVPWVSPGDPAALRRQLDGALDGAIPPAGTAAMADYSWGGVARRYVRLYQSALRHEA